MRLPQLNDQGRIDYLLYKRVWPTSARDFCLASQWRVARDGTITVVATSVDHPGCPEVDGNVRADLEVGGWVLRPHGRDGMSTKVTYLVIMGEQRASGHTHAPRRHCLLTVRVRSWVAQTSWGRCRRLSCAR